MARTTLVWTVTFCGCCLIVVSAQRLDSTRTAIDAYRTAIQRAEKDPSHRQLETAFNAIAPLRKTLLMADGGGDSPLEKLSEQEFNALRRDLVGLHVNREEVVLVEPDGVFFRRLAARGDSADRAFFTALSATYPESIWPVYIEQQTDYSGCTRFGSGTLVSTYLTWSTFRTQYPKRYDEASRGYLTNVADELTGSTCACGDRASVERELSEFARRANASELRAQVDGRLADVQSGRAKIRSMCTSG